MSTIPKPQNQRKEEWRVSAPSISLPKGGGAIQGIGEKFAANPVTGTGSMTVPIATSPGRSGFGPQLSLSYDSGAGNGPFGLGWSLSLPSITRKTDKGLPQYRDAEESDVFILSGAEDLVPVYRQDPDGSWVAAHPGYRRDPEGFWVRDPEGRPVVHEDERDGYRVRRYRPRIEGLFARIERWTNEADPSDTSWRSISRDNITTFYGKTAESRIADPTDPTRIFSWLICQSYDDKGNALVYEYAAENDGHVDHTKANERNRLHTANRYLKRIKYGNRVPNRDATTWQATDPTSLPDDTWMFEVVFDYGEGHYAEDPPDDQDRVFTRAQNHLPLGSRWPVRQDPFSSYRAGFEVRTYRLCRRALMFHHFPQELGIADCLVRATEFSYQENPVASYLTAVTQSGYVRQPAQNQPNRYLKKSLSPLELTYSQVPTPDELARQPVREVDAESLENLPVGLDDPGYQWIDLDGEGASGILAEQADGWYYKRNLSPTHRVREDGHEHTAARLGPAEVVARKPAVGLAGGGQFLDLAGDGQVDLVQMEGSVRGFYERTEDAGWAPFRPFASWPDLNTLDPDLRFVDLTGDGHADLLITEGEALTWYPSLAEEGFGPAVRVNLPLEEEKGPRLVFADGLQSVYLADMSGDGLSDLVRICNGEVCYWPNLGYGRFGAKVTMDNAPWFDTPDQFDPRRIRLADTDGSGTTDILYLGRNGVRIYFNQSGNGWSDGVALPQFPPIDNISSVHAVDLLGNGTACLVWSSALPGASRRPMRYLALMEEKPHLLVGVKNNLGAETRVTYAPSTKFYLADKLAGQPWVTRLPFPVHVVERVETFDAISQNRFVTRYAYHHGYFDGPEREFRGFGMVEQWDTEEFAALTASGTLPEATNIGKSSHVPPVLTCTWFHTGAFLDEHRISKQFEHEYYREGDPSESVTGLTDVQLRALLLDDTLLPSTLRLADGTRRPYTLSAEEVVEACRALKGAILRQEVYALDGTDEADRPYSTSERNYTLELLQPRAGNRHAVFFTHPREQVDFHYERKLVEVGEQKRADPRVSHALTLEVDPFGNVLRSLAIGYRRRDLPGVDAPEQKQTHLTFTVNRFVNHPGEADWYRVGLPVETRTYEVVNPPTPTITDTRIDLFRFEEVAALTAGLFPPDQPDPPPARLWPYEKWDWHRNPANAPLDTRLRLIEHVRTVYRRDDLTGPLPLGQVESLALPFENYKLAFTSELAQRIFVDSGKLTAPALAGVLADEGKYVHSEGDANWWIPSGRIFYSPGSNDTATEELAHARTHFFLPHRYRDPFHTLQFSTETVVTFDDHRLLVVETRDALSNRVRAQNDYRVLAPRLMTDPNGNRSEAAFDALGLVVATAVKGKVNETLGDLLEDFDPDPSLGTLQAFVADPHGRAASLLGKATTRFVYDLDRYWRSGQPPFAATLARETHFFDPGGPQTKIQISFTYSDGFGREIQKKIQAERGDAPQRGPNVTLASGDIRPGELLRDADGKPVQADTPQRWVGSGRTVFNNKGKPVKKYEPFFSSTHLYEEERDMTDTGVSPILFYDPVERVVATLHPNHTWEKVVFDPWRQETWDVNDTVAKVDPETGNVVSLDPRTDPDVGDFFRRLPEADYWPTWHVLRTDPTHAAAFSARYPDPKDRANETSAARKAEVHAGTPTVAHFDALGRTFLTVAHNKFKYSHTPPADPPVEEFYRTRVILDIEGNPREVRDAIVQNGDALGRVVMRYDYDLLSNRIHQASMEAGERWVLNDVVGNPIRAWDSRGHQFKTEYDRLRRLLCQFVRGTDATHSDPRTLSGDVLFAKIEYGEGQTNDTALNLRTRLFKQYDGAGVVTNEAYDFKGNLLRSSRALADDYKKLYDWAVDAVQPSWETYTGSTTYDALNRPVEVRPPDGSIIRPTYNEANLLERLEANLRGAATATVFVADLDYNAKGQRERIAYGNGAVTTYDYDPLTFRLTRLRTIRSGSDVLQDLTYTYDPAGNITHIRDEAQQTIYFKNKRVEPSAEYTYDALYRLIEATGREHLGQAGGAPIPHSYNDAPRVGLLHPGDGNAMGTYLERYLYDAVGNFLQMQHRGTDPAHPGWTRTYAYNEPSLLEPGKQSNRLTSTTVGNGNPITEPYSHDAHGNMLHMPQLQTMQWDFRDQLQMTRRQAVNNDDTDGAQHQGERTYYVYDSGGQRVRKVTELSTGQVKDERIYLGGFEIYRRNGLNPLVRETLHLMDDKQRIALVETRTQGNDGSPPQLIRYQLGNHLGSASLELDDAAQIISYEEYTPYGSTSYQAARSQTETPKRYRYTGKERDEESGLYYHGARYYAAWLGRWTSADPLGIADGPNLYSYVRNHPISLIDPSGMQGQPQLHLVVTDDPSSNTYEVGEFGSGTYLRETEEYTEVWKEGGPQVVSFADDKITAKQKPPPPPKPQPKTLDPEVKPFDPMADNPFAKWLLYQKDSPILDALTNDKNLSAAQDVAAGIAIVAGTIATGGLLAEAAVGAGYSAIVAGMVAGGGSSSFSLGARSLYNGTEITPQQAIVEIGSGVAMGGAMGAFSQWLSGLRGAAPLPPVPQAQPAAQTEAAILFEARDQAVQTTNKLIQQEVAAGNLTQRQVPLEYGKWLDAIGKANVRQAIQDSRLPNTYTTSPTVGINRGFPRAAFKAPDIWDRSTGVSWDFHTPNARYFYQHEAKYLGVTLSDGTVVTEVNPLFYFRF